MERVDAGGYANWTTHPNNPASVNAAAQQTTPEAEHQAAVKAA